MTRPYTSVWDDLNQVEFSQGFIQAGPTGPDTCTPATRPSPR